MIQYNVNLSKLTTIHIGGIAENFFIPESYEELKEILGNIKGEEYRVISAGSNLLINDKKVFKNVISMTKLNNNIIHKSNGLFYVGASVRIQRLIKESNKEGFGGLEPFCSIPALVGGMIYMNAGVGRKKNNSIGDYIDSVDILEGGERKTIGRESCGFGYRCSIFQEIPQAIILGANIQLSKTTIETAESEIKKRIDYVRKTQDHSGFNFGTLFSEADTKIIALTRFLYRGNKDGVHFSHKHANCLINNGHGSFADAMKLIKAAQRLHKLFHKNCQLEVRIWE